MDGLEAVAQIFGTEDMVPAILNDSTSKLVVEETGMVHNWKYTNKKFTIDTCFTIGEEFKMKQPLMKNEECTVRPYIV